MGMRWQMKLCLLFVRAQSVKEVVESLKSRFKVIAQLRLTKKPVMAVWCVTKRDSSVVHSMVEGVISRDQDGCKGEGCEKEVQD